MLEHYKVSILIPVYGVEKYIERCARSVFEQTYHNLEIIFVDDCTPDHSIEILKRVLEEYPERKEQTKILHHQKNGGLSVARNTAFAASSGDYVYYLDSDDEMKRDCISIMTEPLTHREYDFIISDYEEVGFSVKQPHLHLPNGEYKGDEILNNICSGKWFVMAWNKLIKRDFYEIRNLSFYPGIIHEDELWSFKLACTANSMYLINEQTMIYYRNSNSIMTSMSAKRDINSSIIILREVRKLMMIYHLENIKYEKYLSINIFRCRSNFIKLGQSDFKWYKIVFHDSEPRDFPKKLKICFSEGFHPLFIHRILPTSIGYIYFRIYSRIHRMLS